MGREKYRWLSLILALVTALSLMGAVYAPVTLPSVSVDPEESKANPGDTFTVNVDIADVVDLYSWGIKIMFNPNVLECTDVTEGPFLQGQPGGSSFVKKIYINYINVGCVTLGAYPGVSGSGTLMTATFTVKDSGKSALNIDESTSQLLNSTLGYLDHTVSDGYFCTDRADLVGRSAWPEHHHFVISKDEDFDGTYANQTLYCKVKNLGLLPLNVYVTFDIVRDDSFVTSVSSEVAVVPGETIVTLSANFTVSNADVGKYYVNASALYSWSGFYYTQGEKVKTFSFAVV